MAALFSIISSELFILRKFLQYQHCEQNVIVLSDWSQEFKLSLNENDRNLQIQRYTYSSTY